jgi:mitogen-activated protein kinase organizer 1
MDKTSGKLLQEFKSPNFSNTSYRLRSTLAASDSLAVSGTEDGRVLVWDVLSGTVSHELWQDDRFRHERAGKRSVTSVVKECAVRDEWCSAGGDGKSFLLDMYDAVF